MSSNNDKPKSKLRQQADKVKKMLGLKKKDDSAWDKDPEVGPRIAPFFISILERPTQELLNDFENFPKHFDLKKMKAFDKNAAKGRNRFNHIGCWDESRVELTLGPVDYIHANYIATPKNSRRIIATQAPLDKTCIDFWYMVLQEQPDIIIGLCQLDEKQTCVQKDDDEPVLEGTICSRYFPLEKHDVVEFSDGELKVECTGVKQHEYSQSKESIDKTTVIERKLSVVLNNGERSLVCRHYHWIHNKHEAGQANSTPMQFLESLPKTDKPIVMQCRNGVNLTGAFVMFQYYLDLLETDCDILPPIAYLKELREQRHNFLNQWQFFYFVHMVMLRYFWEKIGMTHDKYPAFDRLYGKEMQKFDLDS